MEANMNEMGAAQFINQLKATFGNLPQEIPIYLFTQPGRDDIFVQTNRQIIRAFRELTDKITFREYNLDHELAKKWDVTRAPTLLISPDKYNIRWLGAPMGEEGRTLLETLLLVGRGIVSSANNPRKFFKKLILPER